MTGRSLFLDAVPRGLDRRIWAISGLAALSFALSAPLSEAHPMIGHLLVIAQVVAIALPAWRFGAAGAAGGSLFSFAAFAAADAVVAMQLGAARAGLWENLLLAGAATVGLGAVCGALGQGQVTQQRANAALRVAERRLAALIDAMPSGFLVASATGQIEFTNAQARRLLGLGEQPEGAIGRTLQDLVDPSSWSSLVPHLANPQPGEPIRLRLAGAPGIRTGWVFGRPTEAGAGRALAFFWNAEEQVRREEEALSLDAAARSLLEGVLLVDVAGVIRYANQAGAHIYGYGGPSELVGTLLSDHVAPRLLDGYAQRMAAARSVGWSAEVAIRRPDGEEVDVHVTTSPVNVGGVVIGTVGVVRDLTESKLIARRTALSDKQATLGRLVAGVAHEINNPLAAVVSHAELLQERDDLDVEARQSLGVIHTEGRRAGRIVRDLLAFARQRPVARTRVDLSEIALQCIALRESYARAAGIHVTVQSTGAAMVQADPDQLKQVFLNLLGNAEDAVKVSAVKRIRVTVGHRCGSAVVLVSDSGPGVPERLRQQIFEPFFTTKKEGQGTGLGLAVSAGIVAEHGGRITVESGLEGGAEFVVELPVATGEPAPSPERPASAACPTGAGAVRHVLLVDDEGSIARGVSRLLARRGYSVRVAATGMEALALVRAARPDVIISDFRMPVMSGGELYDRLAAEGLLEGCRFVVSTGDIGDPEAHEFVQAAELPVLLKPYEVQQLLTVIASAPAKYRKAG
jgi:two-component system NtrC family sensor kinase